MKITESKLRQMIREDIMRLSSIDNEPSRENVQDYDFKPSFMMYDKVLDETIGMDDFEEINRIAFGFAMSHRDDNIKDWYPITITDTHTNKILVSFDNIGIHSHYNNKEFTWEEYYAIMKRKQIFNVNNMKITESKLRKMIRESIEEISNQLSGSAIKQAQEKNRYYQSKNMTKMTVDKVNSKYAFKTPVEDNGICEFTINHTPNWGFFIWVNYDGNCFALKPYLNHFKFLTYDSYVSETPIGFVIDNLKAGERIKLKGLANSVKELNGENEEELTESAIKSKYFQAALQLMEPIKNDEVEQVINIFNTFDTETKYAVYHFYGDTGRINPEITEAMRNNL